MFNFEKEASMTYGTRRQVRSPANFEQSTMEVVKRSEDSTYIRGVSRSSVYSENKAPVLNTFVSSSGVQFGQENYLVSDFFAYKINLENRDGYTHCGVEAIFPSSIALLI